MRWRPAFMPCARRSGRPVHPDAEPSLPTPAALRGPAAVPVRPCGGILPGRKPPVLLHSDTVANMKPGSIVIDLAAGRGDNGSGNCPLTQADKIVEVNGVKIIGYTNLASMVAADASALYARNLLGFMKLIVDAEAKLIIPADDDIVTACLMCRDGQAVRKN